MDAWISRELQDAPEGLSHGWFISNLEFYDLQDSLSDGTLVAMALSVAVAFSVMLLTTWNVVISLYAIASIAGTIFVTVGSLVLLGWELNVLESVTISVAVGLSVDFAVHYGVAYRLAPDTDREGKVVFSLGRMGSAIAMAAFTTFVAGAMMMPSDVLAYTQLGTFMMLIMCVSWAFATFFFQCLCRCLGPQGSCGQIPLPRKLQCQVFSEVAAAAGVGGPSPQVSSKGTGLGKLPGDAENYELEPLASSQKGEDRPDLGTQLRNGALPQPYSTRTVPENGHTATALNTPHLPPPQCQYSQVATCTCGGDPAPLSQPWSFVQPARDSSSSSCPPQLFPNAAPNADPLFADCHVRYVRGHPAHFLLCSRGRALLGCHRYKHCVRPPGCSPGEQWTSPPAGREEDCGPVTSNSGQKFSTPTPKPAHTGCCPSTPLPSPLLTNGGCHGDESTLSDTLAKDEESVQKCGSSKRQRATSPKKLNCLNRTLKVKCSSASEFNVPKTETSVPPLVVNSKESTESLC